MNDRPIPFVKMTGSGNDFVIVDNRDGRIDPDTAAPWVRAVCRRGLSVGADGVILLQDDAQGEADFAWRFFNSDGSEAEMCGNGGRCAVRFAFDHGLAARREMTFRTVVGLIRGTILDGGQVRVGLTPPTDYRPEVRLPLDGAEIPVAYIDTGVPHAVVVVDDAAATDVDGRGRVIRRHAAFQPRGANVNFVQVTGAHDAIIRTYERGVEGETLACGTGCTAAGVVLGLAGRVTPPVRLATRGGDVLTVDYRVDAGRAVEPTLQGPARYVARGEIDPEAWRPVRRR